MVRFHRGNPRLGRQGDLAELVVTLAEMDDYVQMPDRDAIHLLAALNFDRAAFARGLPAPRLTLWAAKVLRMIQRGEGKEFTRSPESASDDGLDEFEVTGYLQAIAELAVRAEVNGRAVVSVMIFDEELLVPPKSPKSDKPNT